MAIKYFCDKCGNEIGRRNWYGSGTVSVAQPQGLKAETYKTLGRKFDFCDECYKKFSELFKKWKKSSQEDLDGKSRE